MPAKPITTRGELRAPLRSDGCSTSPEKARTGHQEIGMGVPGPAPVDRPGAGLGLP